MLIAIDFHSAKPAYQQIRDQIVDGLARGELPEGTSLPSIRQLGQDLGLNLHTVNKAYDLLREEGLAVLSRRQGAIIHVTAKPSESFRTRWEHELGVLMADAWVRGLSRDAIQSAVNSVLNTFSDPGAGAVDGLSSTGAPIKNTKDGSL